MMKKESRQTDYHRGKNLGLKKRTTNLTLRYKAFLSLLHNRHIILHIHFSNIYPYIWISMCTDNLWKISVGWTKLKILFSADEISETFTIDLDLD